MTRPSREDFIRETAARTLVAIVGSLSVIESRDSSGAIAASYAKSLADALPPECFEMPAPPPTFWTCPTCLIQLNANVVGADYTCPSCDVAQLERDVAGLREALGVALADKAKADARALVASERLLGAVRDERTGCEVACRAIANDARTTHAEAAALACANAIHNRKQQTGT